MADSFLGIAGDPLGLRNNNPGDFRVGIAWQGMVGSENGFITFQDVAWGLRALALDLINNINKGNDTITTFITQYAPPSENDTAGYIASVSADTGLDPNLQLGTDNDTIHSMMRAIINKEIGVNYSLLISDADIDTGIGMAGGEVPTLGDAISIALQNPGIYIQSLSLLQWALIVATAGSLASLIYLFRHKAI